MPWLRSLPSFLFGVLVAAAMGCETRSLDPDRDGGAGGRGTVITDDGGLGADTFVIDAPVSVDHWIEPCGNGRLDPGEACDDGNLTAGDGCTSVCQIECYALCGCGVPGPCIVVTHICGDQWRSDDEICDDGNQTSGDGCAGDCKTVEVGWLCPVSGNRCVPLCGDGRMVGSETCDDGNQTAGDGCSDICEVEPSTARCGDGIISGAEECDLGAGNDGAYGGCTTACRFGGNCGDGVRNGPEECDSGGTRNNVTYGNKDGCARGCLFPHFCGDAIVDIGDGEQCDFGASNGSITSPCTVDCKVWIN